MTFMIDEIYHGFKLLEETKIKEINSIGRIFQHEKSGAKLFHIENDDDNKVFSITFRTPPNDSTGLPHILEHSVLCGSRKFPIKDPFVELAKGSLNTFLNAMTFSDKTMYPIASRNDKDFFNLMDVYLDAVFYPNIYDNPKILMQEGWHYELETPEDDITYRGVVYNEMKGVFSSPEQILFRKIQETLFPDTNYRYESGGDPDVIPELTQENFLDFHRKLYHPSNSYIFLYGNGDIMEQLKFIDTEYLNNFEKIDIDSRIPLQKPFDTSYTKTIEYPISANEKEENKTFLSLNFVVGEATDAELHLAFEILTYLLLETPAAPLKKALLEANLGEDVFGSYDNSILQPVMSVVVKNSNEDKKERFQKVVIECLERLVSEGIDKKLIEAAINIHEFKLREADYGRYPKGLIYCMKSMESWLYDKSPILHLAYEEPLKKIKTALTTNYFEKLIVERLLNNTHSSLLIVKPKKNLAQVKEDEIKEKLKKYKESLSEEEINQLIDNTKELRKYQEIESTPKELEKIPLLSIEDIDKKPEKLPLVERNENNIPILFHPMFTNEIAYVNLYFNTKTVPQDLIPYISLLRFMLGNVSTKNYSYEDLSNEINIHTGGINPKVDVYSLKDNDEEYFPKLIIQSSSLIQHLPKLFELIGEQIGHTRFDEANRIQEIIREVKSKLEMNILRDGHVVAARRATSYFSSLGVYNELITGIDFYKFILELEENFNDKIEEIQENLKTVSKKIFNKDNLMISVTMDEKNYNKFKEKLPFLMEYMGNETLADNEYKFEFLTKNEGLLTSSKVQYVAKAYNFRKLGYDYTGSLEVLRTIISLDYLWNRVRVTGGAYGAMVGFNRNGNMYFTSYRDPNLINTLKVYDEAYKYLKDFTCNEREMRKYIIGTISKMDTPLTPSMKGQLATARYISKVSHEDLQKERDEVLSTKEEDIRELSDLVKDVMDKNNLSVLGNERTIKTSGKEVFKNFVEVFK